jgi:hypothetical protein
MQIINHVCRSGVYSMPSVPNGKTYQRLSLAEKQALQRERMREPAVTCPVCETQTTAADLLEHIETRCPGPREPNPSASWVSWRQAVAMGVPRETMFRWARQGLVRFRGERQDRRYLLRDLAVSLARRRAQQRRDSHKWEWPPTTPGSAEQATPNSDGIPTNGNGHQRGEI